MSVNSIIALCLSALSSIDATALQALIHDLPSLLASVKGSRLPAHRSLTSLVKYADNYILEFQALDEHLTRGSLSQTLNFMHASIALDMALSKWSRFSSSPEGIATKRFPLVAEEYIRLLDVFESRVSDLSGNSNIFRMKHGLERTVKQIRRILKARGNNNEMIRKIRLCSGRIEPKTLTAAWNKNLADDSNVYIGIFNELGIPQLGHVFVKLKSTINRLQSLYFGSVVFGVQSKQAVTLAQAAYDSYPSPNNLKNLTSKMEQSDLGVYNMILVAVRTISCERTFSTLARALVRKLTESAPVASDRRRACLLWGQMARKRAEAFDERLNPRFEECIAKGNLLELAIVVRQVIKMESYRMTSFYCMSELLAAIVASI